MRNIIKVLLNEGIKHEDILAICKYIKEEYEVVNESNKVRKSLNKEVRFKKLNPNGVEVDTNNGTTVARSAKELQNLTGIGDKDTDPDKKYAEIADYRNAMGRDGEFRKDGSEQSVSNKAAVAYRNYKSDLKGYKEEVKDKK